MKVWNNNEPIKITISVTFDKDHYPYIMPNYSDITDILDYETAKAKMCILKWKCEIIEEFSV